MGIIFCSIDMAHYVIMSHIDKTESPKIAEKLRFLLWKEAQMLMIIN